MSLESLVGRTLEKVEPDSRGIQRLLTAAERNIADAYIEQVSAETRFDAAYKAIMQLANAALQANGYRTLTSKPGHHMTMIQTLAQTIGLDSDSVIVLDALRKQRNAADYSGEIIPESATRDCILQAERLMAALQAWLKVDRPDLLG